VRLVPCAPEHYARLRELHLEPEVRRWWQDPADDFPANAKRSTNYTVVLGEQVIGFAQWYSEEETIIRFAGLDLFLDPAVHGRGLGLETVRVLCAHLIDDHGFHRIVADPEVENETSIACFRKAGFRPVGVLRHSAERPATRRIGRHEGRSRSRPEYGRAGAIPTRSSPGASTRRRARPG
jgi:aminoglycoside 6'-N-acetyltransferase